MSGFDDAYIRFMSKISKPSDRSGSHGSAILESALSEEFRECFADAVVIDLIRTATAKKLASPKYSDRLGRGEARLGQARGQTYEPFADFGRGARRIVTISADSSMRMTHSSLPVDFTQGS